MDAMSKAQAEVIVFYAGFISAWFCFLIVLNKMNLRPHDVPTRVSAALCMVAALAIPVGFVMRENFFKLTREVLPHDARKASQLWRSANIVSFGCAISPAIYGVVLKLLGSGWLVPGILFGLSLGFLLLWRPTTTALTKEL